MKVTAVPTIPIVGPVTLAARATPGLMEIVADAEAVTALPSVIVTDTVLVPLTE